LSTKPTPFGSDPDSDNVGVGTPLAVTVNEPALPWVKVALLDEVMVGATGAGLTVREKVAEWVADDPVPVTVIG
jgi:hypothetical protein